MSAGVDEPVPYRLTDVARAALAAAVEPVATYTVAEAVEATGAHAVVVRDLALHGDVDAVKVDGRWLVDGGSLHDCLRRTTQPPPAGRQRRLPAAPLLRQIELAGGDSAVGVHQHTAVKRMLERAREDGTVTVWAADHLSVSLLGLTLWDLWPEASAC